VWYIVPQFFIESDFSSDSATGGLGWEPCLVLAQCHTRVRIRGELRTIVGGPLKVPYLGLSPRVDSGGNFGGLRPLPVRILGGMAANFDFRGCSGCADVSGQRSCGLSDVRMYDKKVDVRCGKM
jgi:hypothetical protein